MVEPRAIFEVEWPPMKDALAGGRATFETWSRAHDRLLRARLKDRYLDPIETIRGNGTFVGEGFAILTIQCALIEFLAALRRGWNYRHGAKFGDNNEYGQSGKLYAEFLVEQAPFSELVPDMAGAYEFYSDVRCGLPMRLRPKTDESLGP